MALTRRRGADAAALIFTEPRRVVLRDEPRPVPAAGALLAQTVCSAISAGTELLIYRGEAPADMAADSAIAALGGSLAYPLKYGYAAVGRVVGVGPGVATDWLGRLVFAFNPHETHFTVPAEQALPVPAGLDPELAALLPNMETAVSLVMDGRPAIGERVAVFGQGVVGLLTTRLLAQMPLEALICVDPLPLRRDYAQRYGGQARPDAPETADCDLAYELSGNPAALNAAIAAVGYGGRVVIGSWYGAKTAALELGGRFHRNHIQLIGSQVSTLAPRWRGRWTKARRLATAQQWLLRTQPRELITHRIPFEQAAEAYHLLDTQPDQALQIVLMYGGD